MKTIDLDKVKQFVNENIIDFHNKRIKSLEELKLIKLLKKNPYLFKAKNINTASELISSLLEAFLSSSEEKLFGDFLSELKANNIVIENIGLKWAEFFRRTVIKNSTPNLIRAFDKELIPLLKEQNIDNLKRLERISQMLSPFERLLFYFGSGAIVGLDDKQLSIGQGLVLKRNHPQREIYMVVFP